MFFKKIYYVIFFLLVSCSENVSDINTKKTVLDISAEVKPISDIRYQMIKQEKIVKDDNSPLGEWTLSASYPELKGKINDNAKIKINSTILELSGKYRCPARGEHTFSSEVKFIGNMVFSMTYEAMWYCPPMSSPDSTSGALTFNLKTGENIRLDTEFINTKAHENFSLFISKRIKDKLQSGKTCPVKDQFDYYYKTKNSLVFVTEMERHSDSGCSTDINISTNDLKKYLKVNSLLLL